MKFYIGYMESEMKQTLLGVSGWDYDTLISPKKYILVNIALSPWCIAFPTYF